MDKTRINLDILLPEVPDERDACVQRIIQELSARRGIEKIHVVPGGEHQKAQLCFHYDPNVINLQQIQLQAKQAGAGILQKYGHLLFEVDGVRHARHARIIESRLRAVQGVQHASVSVTGFIQVEFEKANISRQQIEDEIKNIGLTTKQVKDFHAAAKNKTAANHIHGAGEKEHHHEHDQEHAHGIFGERSELIFAGICGAFLAIGFSLSFVNGLSPLVVISLYCVAYFFGGYYTSKEAIEGVRQGHFEIDFLMLVAAIGAAILGHWAEGALLLFLFSLGHSLEHYAMGKAKKSIAALTELAPKTAFLKLNGGLKEVGIETLQPGDVIVVKPNSAIAADGIVIHGNSDVNQAPITGESVPVEKTAVDNADVSVEEADKIDEQHRVFAGAINGGQALEIKVSKVAANSTIARLVKLVNEAQTQKSATQNFADKLEKYYVPAVLVLVVVLLFAFVVIDEPFSDSFYRAMAVLVAASPCALAISTPSAVLSGVARAARGGVLIKGGKPLEALGSLTAIAFDKTGTLTQGKPTLTGVYPLNNTGRDDLLKTLIAVEQLSDHPLAAAIVTGAKKLVNTEVGPAQNVQSITGKGVQAQYLGQTVLIGNRRLFADANTSAGHQPPPSIEEYESKGNTTMLVQVNGVFTGIVTLMDVPRPDAKQTLQRLKQLGVRKMIMLTGDNQKVAESIAAEIGITEAMGNLLPEQKVAAIDKLTATGPVAMVGDGVNDAPAMAKSTVGIAMGAAGSDVALETADIALMGDQLTNLPFAIGLSKKARTIIRQNLFISLGMVAILVPLTLLGIAEMGPAVIGHEGSTVVVVFNALRLLVYKKEE